MVSKLGFQMGLGAYARSEMDKEALVVARVQELNDKKRQWLFTSYQTDRAARSKTVAARKTLIKKAMGEGFSKKAAYLLESTGELSEQLSRISELKSKGKYNREKVILMSDMVLQTLEDKPEEQQAAALAYIAQGDLNFSSTSEFEDEFVNAIFSADPDSLKKATELYSDVMAGGGAGGLNFGSLGLSSRPFGDYGTTQRAGVDKLIAQRTEGFFKESTFTYSNNGEDVRFKGEDKEAAQDLFNKMNKVIEESYYDPSMVGDWKASIDIMARNLKLQSDAGLKVNEYVISADPNFEPAVPTIAGEGSDEEPLDNGVTPSVVEEVTTSTNPLDMGSY